MRAGPVCTSCGGVFGSCGCVGKRVDGPVWLMLRHGAEALVSLGLVLLLVGVVTLLM